MYDCASACSLLLTMHKLYWSSYLASFENELFDWPPETGPHHHVVSEVAYF